MYLSSLLIDLGENPDRPRPGRLWLRNLYRVHQRLCMAFPSDLRRERDADFLAPYRPDDFPEQRHLADKRVDEVVPTLLSDVHAPRGRSQGFLFRVDPLPRGRAVILVQSAVRPDWDYAFRNACHFLACAPEVKRFDPRFERDQRLRFRLLANPTKKTGRLSKEARLAKEKGRHGRRVAVPTDQFYEWLACRAEPASFSIGRESTALQPGYVYMKKDGDVKARRLRSVRYDGVLNIIDPARFRETVVHGIGPGKAFGFGLLSVAPIDASPPAQAT